MKVVRIKVNQDEKGIVLSYGKTLITTWDAESPATEKRIASQISKLIDKDLIK